MRRPSLKSVASIRVLDACRILGPLFEMLPERMVVTDPFGKVLVATFPAGKPGERTSLPCWPDPGQVGGDYRCADCPVPRKRPSCVAFAKHRLIRHGALRDPSGALAAQLGIVFEDCTSRIAEVEERVRTFENAIRRISSLAATTAVQAGALGFKPTSREMEVLTLLATGSRAKSIASSLGISPSTVRNHLKAIFLKAGVSSQTALLERLKADPPCP